MWKSSVDRLLRRKKSLFCVGVINRYQRDKFDRIVTDHIKTEVGERNKDQS